jgi:putative colanic acid biosynthesis acetyltransferase WcaF
MDLSNYKADFDFKNKLKRFFWIFFCFFFFRPFSLSVFSKWRLFVLRLFGAKIHYSSLVYSSVKIWAPWNLEIGEYSCLGPNVDCYNQGRITIGANTVVSQKTYLCASTHDFTDPMHPLLLRPIIIADKVWVAADVFIGPGVTIGEAAVVGARSAVFKKVEPYTVVGGNPAKFIKQRIFAAKI